jgi:RNA polymerase sigma-70 factor (sigma-E family)
MLHDMPHITWLARQGGVVGIGAGTERSEASFSGFVHRYAPSLFTTAYLLTGDVGQAEELLQDTLVRLYSNWQRVAAAASPVAYVRRSVVNSFISGRRRTDRVVALDGLEDGPAGSRLAGPADALRGLAETVTDRQMLVQLLRELPTRQQAALVLRYFEDLTDAEIAKTIGCRPATVRSLLSRGLAAMRDRTTTETAAARAAEGTGS